MRKRSILILLTSALAIIVAAECVGLKQAKSPQIFELTFTKYGDKYLFCLNGKLWYPKIAIYDPNIGPFWPGNTFADDLEKLLDDGANCIMIPLYYDFIADQVFKQNVLDVFLRESENLMIPVIVDLIIGPQLENQIEENPIYGNMLYNGSYTRSPHMINKNLIDFAKQLYSEIIDYTERFSNIAAYHMESSDWWKIHEAIAEYRVPPYSIETDETQMPYNLGVREAYVKWLRENGIEPWDLGFENYNSIFLPHYITQSRSLDHWLTWKEFRRKGFVLAGLKELTSYVRSSTGKPIGSGVDIGYRFGDIDQQGIPLMEYHEAFDFMNVFLGWEPPQLSEYRGNVALHVMKLPVIGFNDVTHFGWPYWTGSPPEVSHPAYGFLYLVGTASYLSAHMFSVDRVLPWVTGYSIPKTASYKEIMRALNFIDQNKLWMTAPVRPRVAIFNSLPDAMLTGATNHPYDFHYHGASSGPAGMLLRSGIPYSFVWKEGDITKYDVAIAGLTSPYVQLSPRYSSLITDAIRAFLEKGGTLIKGPFPLREKPPAFLDVGAEGDKDALKLLHIAGDGWSEPSWLDNSTIRWTESGVKEIRFRVDESKAYELSIMFKDVHHESYQYKIWMEVKTGYGWKKVESYYYPGCYRLNVWRMLTFIIPPEYVYLEGRYQVVRLMADARFPVTYILLAPLADISPIPELTIYNYELVDTTLQVDLPTMERGEPLSSGVVEPDRRSDTQSWNHLMIEYLRVGKGDTLIATGKVLGRDEGNIVVAKSVEDGLLIKLGFAPGMEWFHDIAWNWSYKGYFNRQLEKFLAGLVLWRHPEARAYRALDSIGSDITGKLIGVISKMPETEDYKLTILNMENETIRYKLYLNAPYLNPELKGEVEFIGVVEPFGAVVHDFNISNYIVIDKVHVSDNRADVGSLQSVGFHLVWSQNLSELRKGTMYINGTGCPINATGWVLFNVRYDSVGKHTWMVTGVSADGVMVYTQEAPNPSIIWDRIKIVDGGALHSRVDVGSSTIVWFKAVYEYDGVIFDSSKGMLYVNGSAVSWNELEKRWETSTDVYDVPTKRCYVVTSVQDDAYSITAVNDASRPVSVEWIEVTAPIGRLPINVLVSTILIITIATLAAIFVVWRGGKFFRKRK